MPLLRCPHCAVKLKIPETLIGRQIACPKCKGSVAVLEPPTVAPEARSLAESSIADAFVSGEDPANYLSLAEHSEPDAPVGVPSAYWQPPVARSQATVSAQGKHQARRLATAAVVGGVAASAVGGLALLFFIGSWIGSGVSGPDPQASLTVSSGTAAEGTPAVDRSPAAAPATQVEAGQQSGTSVDALPPSIPALPNATTLPAADPQAHQAAQIPPAVGNQASLVEDVMAVTSGEDGAPQLKVTITKPKDQALPLWEKGVTPEMLTDDRESLVGAPEKIKPGVLRLADRAFLQSSLSHDGRHLALWQLMSRNSPENRPGRKPVFLIIDTQSGTTLTRQGISGIAAVTFLKDKFMALDMDGHSLHVFDRGTFAYVRTIHIALDVQSTDTLLDKWLVLACSAPNRVTPQLVYLDAETLDYTPESRLASIMSLVNYNQGDYGWWQAPGGILAGTLVWDRELAKIISVAAPPRGVLSIGTSTTTLGFKPSPPSGKRQRLRGGFGSSQKFLSGVPTIASGALVSVKRKGQAYELTFAGDTGTVSMDLGEVADKTVSENGTLPEILASNDSVVLHVQGAVLIITPSQLGIDLPESSDEFAGPYVRVEGTWLAGNEATRLKVSAENMAGPVRFEAGFDTVSELRTMQRLVVAEGTDSFVIDGKRLLEGDWLATSQTLFSFAVLSRRSAPEDFLEWYIERSNKSLGSLGEMPRDDFVVSLPLTVKATGADGKQVQFQHALYLPIPRDIALKWLTIAMRPRHTIADRSLPPLDAPNLFSSETIAEISERVRASQEAIQQQLADKNLPSSNEPLMATLKPDLQVHGKSVQRTWHVITNGKTKQDTGIAGYERGILHLHEAGQQFGQPIQPDHLPPEELAQAVSDIKNAAAEDPVVRDKFTPGSQLHEFTTVHAQNHSGEFGRALSRFEATYQCLPPAAITDAQGRPLLSWRVMLLPQLGYYQLFSMFHLDEPWDSPHNQKLIPLMPAAYVTKDAGLEAGKTRLLALTGKCTAMPADRLVRLSELNKAIDSRVLFVLADAARAVTWTQPIDFVMSDHGPPVAGWAVQRVGEVERFTAITGGGNHVSLAMTGENIAACYWINDDVEVNFDLKADKAPAAKPQEVRVLPAPQAVPMPNYRPGDLGLILPNRRRFLREAFDPQQRLIALTGRIDDALLLYDVNDRQSLQGKDLALPGVLTDVCFTRFDAQSYFVVSHSEPNQLSLIDTKSHQVTATIPLDDVWAFALRVPQGEESPYVYAVCRDGTAGSNGRHRGIRRINLKTGTVEQVWQSYEVYGDLSLFRRDGSDFLNHFQTLPPGGPDAVARPKRVDDVRSDEVFMAPYGGHDEKLTMFPFPQYDMSLWGNGVYTLDMTRLKQRMSIYVATYLEDTAFAGGVLDDEFVFASVNDGRLVARITMPGKHPAERFVLKNEVQSYDDDKIFYSPAAKIVYLVGRDYIATVSLDELELPDEPCLLVGAEPPARCRVGQQYVAHPGPAASGQSELKIIEAPQGAELADGEVRWKPDSSFAGPARFHVRTTSGPFSHDEIWTVDIER